MANDTIDTIHKIWSLKIKKYLPIVSKENLLPVETQNEENTNPTGMFISVKNPDSSEQPTVSFQLKNWGKSINRALELISVRRNYTEFYRAGSLRCREERNCSFWRIFRTFSQPGALFVLQCSLLYVALIHIIMPSTASGQCSSKS